jgi:hypothetical protein
MRIQLQHPAIVSRRKRDPSEPGYAMVKVTSAVELAEYTLYDVQTAVILHHGAGTTTYRRIGEHFFKQLDHMPSTAIAEGSDIVLSMIGRPSHFDFGSFMSIVEAAGRQKAAEDETSLKCVAYLERSLSRAEQRSPGHTGQIKAFAKAPVFGVQSWIGEGADSEIADWGKIFQDFMGNVVIVDGVVHVRSFEPCYKMNLRPPETRVLSIESMSVMEKVLGGSTVTSQGIPILGKDSEKVDDRYFSLNELDRAVELAEQFGFTREWMPDSHVLSATVVDASALSSDFIKEESFRLAVCALSLANDVESELIGLYYSDKPERDVLGGRLNEIAAAEKNLKETVSCVASADDTQLDDATRMLVATLARDGQSLDLSTTRRIGALGEALLFLDARRDTMPISLMTNKNSQLLG